MKMNKFLDYVITFWKGIYLVTTAAVAFSLYLASGSTSCIQKTILFLKWNNLKLKTYSALQSVKSFKRYKTYIAIGKKIIALFEILT